MSKVSLQTKYLSYPFLCRLCAVFWYLHPRQNPDVFSVWPRENNWKCEWTIIGILRLSQSEIGSWLWNQAVIRLRAQLPLYTWVHVQLSGGNSGPREVAGTPWSQLALGNHGEWIPLFSRTISPANSEMSNFHINPRFAWVSLKPRVIQWANVLECWFSPFAVRHKYV